jgi:hypothetical protein
MYATEPGIGRVQSMKKFNPSCTISDMLGDDPDILTRVLAIDMFRLYNFHMNILSYCDCVY